LLQVAFTKNRVQRHIDVDKLIRAKYQDNLEFCQWLKAFYDQSGVHRPDYDAVAVRAKGKGGKKVGEFLRGGSNKGGNSSRPMPAGRRPSPAAPSTTTGASTTSRPTRPLRERPTSGQTQSVGAKTTNKAESAVADAQLMKKNTELTAKVAELEGNVIDIEKERDFYFQKLRDIEVMLQVHQEKGEESDPDVLIENVFKVLYATADEAIVVNDDGEVRTWKSCHSMLNSLISKELTNFNSDIPLYVIDH
jgi:RP/EB family microtubule-associated protein